MDERERYAWLQLALTPYVGAESFLRLLRHYGSASAALGADADEVARLACNGKQAAKGWAQTDKARAAADAALEWARQSGCRLLLLCDDDYPPLLGEGLTPPPLLFVRGDAGLLARPAVAVVGSRHATPQAVRIAGEFAQALSGRGITVVSGMASGIDAAAHGGALDGIGRTVAVWGTGIDRVYPPANRALAHQIAERGAVVSEFPLGTKPVAGNFPRRNRIIAALARAVLVVEAALASGSLITARLAAEMGREVMAVPGSIDNPHSKGCHQLIKQGAKLTETIDDIVQECPALSAAAPPVRAAPPPQQRPAEPHGPLLAALGYDPFHPDALAERLGMAADEVYAQLLELELSGRIAALSGGRFQRV
ncbi:DNA-processing protein DprA [Conchiformibius kuhniae]|uniref:DNA-processing protein DprA n=1 Tax=Conchiformibius kuhniae TaxID=211502 RepID=A0ABD8B7P7_9NEIS|nr:DNA-processing protein DprA [Conchiformibius kuhniae]